MRRKHESSMPANVGKRKPPQTQGVDSTTHLATHFTTVPVREQITDQWLRGVPLSSIRVCVGLPTRQTEDQVRMGVLARFGVIAGKRIA